MAGTVGRQKSGGAFPRACMLFPSCCTYFAPTAGTLLPAFGKMLAPAVPARRMTLLHLLVLPLARPRTVSVEGCAAVMATYCAGKSPAECDPTGTSC